LTKVRGDIPYGLTFDSLGALYVADYGNHRVQKITMNTLTVVTVSGITGKFYVLF